VTNTAEDTRHLTLLAWWGHGGTQPQQPCAAGSVRVLALMISLVEGGNVLIHSNRVCAGAVVGESLKHGLQKAAVLVVPS
jgi:hypothetical protein